MMYDSSSVSKKSKLRMMVMYPIHDNRKDRMSYPLPPCFYNPLEEV